MTDNPETAGATPKPKRKRKPRKVPRRASLHKPAATAEAYPGLTVKECAKACNADGCAISGGLYCAHPRKGGLQGSDMGKMDAIQRLQAAQKQLAVGDANQRFS